MADAGEIDNMNVFKSLAETNWPVDFHFVVINSRVASDNKLTYWDMLAVRVYRSIKITSLSPLDDFGLDRTNAEVEHIPVNVRPVKDLHLIGKTP